MRPWICSTTSVPIAPDNLPDEPAALKRIIAAMAQDALVAQAEIARLKLSNGIELGPRIGIQSEPLSGVGIGLSL